MSRTTEGRDWMLNALFGNPGSRPREAQVIALSENSSAIPSPNTWSGFGAGGNEELASDGFSRAVGVYAHTNGTQIATLQHTFTHSGPSGGGTARTIRKVAVVAPDAAPPGAANSGTYVFIMDQPNPPTLTGTDSLNQTVSIDAGA